MHDHKILLISTGGTIAGEIAADKKLEEYELKKADAFSEYIRSILNYLKYNHEINVSIEPLEFCELDSSDITPGHWASLANLIKEKYDEFDSFVITHGTNTLGYTSAALSFALGNNGKPIVITGAQVPNWRNRFGCKKQLRQRYQDSCLAAAQDIWSGSCIWKLHYYRNKS
jgi:L-asparaginase